MVQGANKARSRQWFRVPTRPGQDNGSGYQQGQVKTMVQGANSARSRQWFRVLTVPGQDSGSGC